MKKFLTVVVVSLCFISADSFAMWREAYTASSVMTAFAALEQVVKEYAKTEFVFGKSTDLAWNAVRNMQRDLHQELGEFIDDGRMTMMIKSALQNRRSLDHQRSYFIQEWYSAKGKQKQSPSYASSSATSSSAASSSPAPSPFLSDKLELHVVAGVYCNNKNIQFAHSFAEDIRSSLKLRGVDPTNEELAQLFDEANRKKCRVEDLMDAFVQKKRKDVVEEYPFRLATTTDSNSSADYGADQDNGGSTAEPEKLAARLRKYVIWGGAGVSAVAVSALIAVGAYWYFFKDAKKEEPSQNVITT